MTFSRLRVVAIALVTVVATTAGAAAFAISKQSPRGSTVVAQFASAAPLVLGNEVKFRGVVVGKVLDMTNRDGRADVLLELAPSAMPLYRNARVTIRPVSLLGERFVDLERGSPDQPTLVSGQPIPPSQTGSNVDLDQILNVFNKPTSEGLAFLTTTLGEGMRGNGPSADAAIRALAPALRDTRALTEIVREQNDLLNGLVEHTEPVAQAVAANDGRAVDGIVHASDKLLAATSAQQEQLDATLAELPTVVESARASLNNLSGAAQETTPALRSLRPATHNLEAITGELSRFSDSLDPALTTAEPVLKRGEELLDQAAPVASSLRDAGPGVRGSAASARPIVEGVTGNLDNVFNFIRHWALATNGRDGLSHYLRINLLVNPATLTGQVPGAVPSPPGPPPPGPTPGLPGVPSLPAVPGLLQPPNGESQQSTSGGATGLNEKQEGDMLGFLLGGSS